jgi:hypothetical protein
MGLFVEAFAALAQVGICLFYKKPWIMWGVCSLLLKRFSFFNHLNLAARPQLLDQRAKYWQVIHYQAKYI